IELLKGKRNFDVYRSAIESLGRVGAHTWAKSIEELATLGSLEPKSTYDSGFDEHAFGKLSTYVLLALARFAAHATDPQRADTMFSRLAKFIELRESNLQRFGLVDSFLVMESVHHEFTERGVDPAIRHWGKSSQAHLQVLCNNLLREVAPLRVAGFLLDTATSIDKSNSVRRTAALALGEIRVQSVAQLVADALRNPATEKTYLDSAFSSLYAVPADWSGLSAYIDSLLQNDNHETYKLQYSLALKGDDRCQKGLIERLDHQHPFERWTAAMALARLLGDKARSHLEHRAEDAGDPLERCGMYAAIIRAGDSEKTPALHEALQQAGDAPYMYTIWQLEILDAFRIGRSFDERAFSLWQAAIRVRSRQVEFFDRMTQSAVSQPTSAQTSVTITEQKPQPNRTKVFISYSHTDVRWLRRLQVHLKPLESAGEIMRWDDTLIKPGENWREEIKSGLEQAKVAVLLISADFLASDFINSDELPALLTAAQAEGLVILPIVLSPSRFEKTKLSQFQAVNGPSRPLNAMTRAKQEAVFVKVSQIIEEAIS
ncbi:MAG TPA: TIR domain-containing protein, partial [Pyrinomonadaceae bacterium]